VAPIVAPGLLAAWIDRLCASRHCGKLRKLCADIRRRHPGLAGTALYQAVVREHLGVTAEAADRIVELAAESFASWPTHRQVTFRDVAHYLAVARLSEGRGWISTDLRHVVNRRLPADW